METGSQETAPFGQDRGNGLRAAVELVKASGGIEGAKAALKTVEEIAKLGGR